MHQALYYDKLSTEDRGQKSAVKCLLCPHSCIIAPGKTGICRARRNIDSVLYAINYGECVSLSMDSIEKKPLYHFYPGSQILSTASNSCNLNCPFCQNAEISQSKAPTQYISPEKLVDMAVRKNSIGIAYTYTEPFTWYEYVLDTAKLAHKQGLKNVIVTNGMINEQPLIELLPYIDAANIDLKSMDSEFYKNILHGELETVLNTIRITKKKWHIEITNLIVPNYNDSIELLTQIVAFVASIGIDTPLHFSRYFPHYKLTIPPTPIETLELAYRIGKEKLLYVYLGNVTEPLNF